jgi:hypothetical protein
MTERSLVSEDGLTLFPITELDQFLRGVVTRTGHVLSRDGVWGSFPSRLETIAASCKSTYHRYYRQHTVTFDVPVISHILLSKDEDGRQPMVRQSFMRWNGKLYDRNFLYTLRADGGSFILREYSPLAVTLPVFPDSKISRLNARIRDFSKPFATGSGFRLIHTRSNIKHTSPYGSAESTEVGSAGILIDLRRPMYVSHIGTMGDAPVANLFPGNRSKPSRGSKRKPCKKKARNGRVYVVDEQVCLDRSLNTRFAQRQAGSSLVN